MAKAHPTMQPPHNRIRTEISANLYAFLKSLPSGPDGAFGELTVYRYSGSLFGFESSLAPGHHFVVKVKAHMNMRGYTPRSLALKEEEDQ